jgi:uncharacterized protein (DUF1501 family)
MKRRDFVKNAGLGAAFMPSIINGHAVSPVNMTPWLETITNSATETDHVLVIIQMNGGNDGLNMVIPVDQYANLSTARANILITETAVLPLNGITGTGLHPAMTGLQRIFNEGKVKIVQGVSYPGPSFSHFRGTDIWMTAANYNEVLTSGWMGRYLSSEYANYPIGYPNPTMPHPLAIQIGTTPTGALQGPAYGMGITISNATDTYAYNTGTGDPAPSNNMGKELTYLRTIARQAQQYSNIINTAYAAGTNLVTYPTANANSLADQLKTVARLIKGGLKTRVYYVSTSNNGSFDTHSNQVTAADHSVGNHATMLGKLSDAITIFQDDLRIMNLEERVIGMTFSEFGRRVKSNASVGTDHGQGAPMFVFGKRVFGGVLGTNYQVPAVTDVNTNIPMQYDFRSIYASILKDWFCVDDTELNAVMLRNYQRLAIVNSPNCITSDVHDLNVAAGMNLIKNYPNPFVFSTKIEFETFGGHTMVQVFDGEGRLMNTLADGDYTSGKYTVDYNGDHLPAGVYYMRLQNEAVQQVKAIVKVR